MNRLRGEAWAAILAFVITLVYIWAPAPTRWGRSRSSPSRCLRTR